MIRVVTSFSKVGYEAYGAAFIKDFRRYWSPLLTVVSEMTERPKELGHDDTFIHLDTKPLRDLTRDPRFDHGSPKNRAKIPKFGAKALAVQQARLVAKHEGWLLWLDADVTFQGCPQSEWFDKVLPKRSWVSCLYRPGRDVETGFVGYRIPESSNLIDAVAGMYLEGTIFNLPDWGDGEAFKHQLYRCVPAHKVHDIAYGLQCTHVWPHTPLAQHLTHHKGVKRKHAAYGVLDTEHPSKLPE